jgi:predicted permease
MLTHLWTDFRHALRRLPRNPTSTTIILLTLALCIGANTAIFSVVDATLLRPLSYPEPERLVRIVLHYKAQGAEGDNIIHTGRTWELIRDHASLVDAAVYSGGASGVNFSAAGSAQFVKQQRVGAGFFRVLGVQPLFGREFTPQEDRAGGPALAVLSFPFWKRVFHGDTSVAGQALMLRGEPYTIVGVMPENFHSNSPVDLWTPLRPSANGEGGGQNYSIMGRLKPGITWSQADGQLESVGAPLVNAMNLRPGIFARLRLITLQDGQTQDLRKPLLILWAAVGLVVLIGCANVTSLLLARAAARSREIATRLAIGGGRREIIQQLLVETLVLALLGGAAGLVVGYYSLEGLKILAAKSFGNLESARLDGRVLAATAILSLLVSLLAGLFPALEAGAVDLRTALSEAGGRGVAGGRKRWSRRLLVGGEIALAVLLLIGAGLLIRTVAHFYQLRPGFDPAHVITASFSLQDARYNTSQRVNQLFDSGLARIRALPGVESAGAGLTLPYELGLNSGFWHADGPEASGQQETTNLCYVTPGYLEALRIPLQRGRTISASDGPKNGPVVVVNEAFARRYLSKQDPLGSHISFGKTSPPAEIIGIVGDVQQSAGFGNFGPLGPVPNAYVPAGQFNDGLMKMVNTWFAPNWVVRVTGAPAAVMQGIQNVASTVDPLVPIAEFRTIDELRAASLSSQRFQATLLGSLSGLALLLAIVGIYGLMSQSVVERRRELGIRMALGATLAQAIREATLPGVMLAMVGVAAGCGLAGLSTRVLEHLVWGVKTTDPATYLGVAAGILLVAAAASLVPALRITRLNPAETLRDE